MSSKLLVTNINVANRLIILLTVTSISVLIVLLFALGVFEHRQFFNREVKDTTAFDYIDEFRDDLDLRKKTDIIWYSPDSIERYLNTTFKVWKTVMTKMPDNSTWGIGFYPMRRTDPAGKKNRVDFLIIPTLFQVITLQDGTKDTIIYDFRNEAVRKDYYQRNGNKIPGLCDTCTGYDAGHLWP